VTISLHDVAKLLAQNICDERWGEDGDKHTPGAWDYACAESNIKALQAAGYDIIKNELPRERMAINYTDKVGNPRVKVTEDPRWAEADDVPMPFPDDVTRGGTLGGGS